MTFNLWEEEGGKWKIAQESEISTQFDVNIFFSSTILHAKEIVKFMCHDTLVSSSLALTLTAAAVEEETTWRQGWGQFHIQGRARSPGSCHFHRWRSSLAFWTPPRALSHMTCQNKTEPPAPWRTSCSGTGSLCVLQQLSWVGRRNRESHGALLKQHF